MRVLALASVAASFLVACTTLQEPPAAGVPIAEGVSLRLPAAPPFGDVQAVQLITARYKDRQESLQAVVQAGTGHMKVIVTLPSGPRVLSVAWDGGKVETTREAMTPESLSGDHLIADIMTIYAPAEVLRAGLSGATLEVEASGARRIVAGGQPVISVVRPAQDPWRGRAVLENTSYGYRLDIVSQDLE